MTSISKSKFYHYDFLQLCLVYLPRLSCQYGCPHPIKWRHFCFQRLLVVHVHTNSFHVAEKRFHTNTSGCTELIYHADLGTLWVLVWDSQTQGGQWSQCVYHKPCIFGSAPFSNMLAWKFLVGRLCSCATMMKPLASDFRPNEASHLWVSEEFTSGSLARIRYLPWRGLSFHPSFSSLFFFVFACA